MGGKKTTKKKSSGKAGARRRMRSRATPGRRADDDTVSRDGQVRSALSRAAQCQMAGRFAEADALYRDVLRDFPAHAEALQMAGRLALRTGDYPRAAALLEKAISRRSAAPDLDACLATAYNGLGAGHLAEANPGDAAVAFRKAVNANPKDIRAYNNLGSVLRQAGKTDEAINWYRKAVEIDPNAAAIHTNLGNALFARGDTGPALRSYRKALDLSPGYARGHFNLAVSLSALQRFAEAVEHYQAALNLDPHFFEACNNLGALYKKMDRLDEAIATYRKAIALRPDSAQAHCGLGMAYHAARQYDAAGQTFRNALAINPDDDEAHYGLGLCCHLTGDMERAAAGYQRALELRPDHYRALYALANAHVAAGRLEAAVQCYRKVIDGRGSFQDVYNQLAEAYRKLGRDQDAIHWFRRALETNPGDQAAAYMLAALEGTNPDAAPPEVLEKMFDAYADTFDRHLTGKLAYQTPLLLKNALIETAGDMVFYENALDIGCGTGLSGAAFRNMCARLEGVDLSAEMITKARHKNLYDHLCVGHFLEIYAHGQTHYDLIIAADVFVYTGNLEPLFRRCARLCAPGAYFVFSTERHDGDAFILRPTGRYAHSQPYIQRLAADNRFSIEICRQVRLRKENDQWVQGEIFILKSV